MPSKQKKQRQKSARAPIHLDDFGCVLGLIFGEYGCARVQMNSLEIEKLLGAIQRYILRKQKIPSPRAIEALDTLQNFFSEGKNADITITADMVIGVLGVEFQPMQMGLPEMKRLLKKKKPIDNQTDK